MNKIDSNKKIYKILNEEIKKFIHSIQILINLILFLKIDL